MNSLEHWFWWALSWASLIWYSTITVYVAYRGVADVRGLLARLASSGKDDIVPPTLHSRSDELKPPQNHG